MNMNMNMNMKHEHEHDPRHDLRVLRWADPSAGLGVSTEQPSALGEAKTPTAEREGDRGVQMV